MKLITAVCMLYVLSITTANSQTVNGPEHRVPRWTEEDRKFLIDNLSRTKQAILEETKNLTPQQWLFKESKDRWNINQIVEHIAIWELLFMREVSQTLANRPDSAFTSYLPDSVFLYTDQKAAARNALEYTKPFSFAVPLGNNEGADNIIWFTKMRDESIAYLSAETRNIRIAYDKRSGRNVHHYYLMIFGHTDNHLRQIRKVKDHPKYPR